MQKQLQAYSLLKKVTDALCVEKRFVLVYAPFFNFVYYPARRFVVRVFFRTVQAMAHHPYQTKLRFTCFMLLPSQFGANIPIKAKLQVLYRD